MLFKKKNKIIFKGIRDKDKGKPNIGVGHKPKEGFIGVDANEGKYV